MSKSPIGPHWYAVQTRSNSEGVVTSELNGKGVENFCPAFGEVHQWADRKKLVQRPLFPGYVFVRFVDSGSARLSVLQTSGAVRILGIGEKLEAIPDKEIESIERVLKSGKSCFAHPFLPEGSRVRVRCGPLRGVEGVLVRVKSTTRLVLSINLVSYSVAMEVGMSDVEVIRRTPHS